MTIYDGIKHVIDPVFTLYKLLGWRIDHFSKFPNEEFRIVLPMDRDKCLVAWAYIRKKMVSVDLGRSVTYLVVCIDIGYTKECYMDNLEETLAELLGRIQEEAYEQIA